MTELQDFFSIDQRLLEAAQQAEDACKADFERIEKNAAYNSAKVLAAFQKSRVSEPCFYGTTGYGYGDQGREVLDQVFAEAFGAEDALVRHNFVSGTHALTVALFGVLRTGDKMVALTGRPYDTLEGVIGLTGDAKSGSLQNFGVQYGEIPLLADGTPDYDAVADAVQGARVAYIQRSRGYSLRPALTIAQIRRLSEIVRRANPDAVIMVDNCYGEFVETQEPVQADCDLMIGSMIKNVGGGIARTGGYIAGRKDLVQQCAERLTCIGMGKEVGCTLDMNREMYLGFFHAPETTAQALKTADLQQPCSAALASPATPVWARPVATLWRRSGWATRHASRRSVRAFSRDRRWIPMWCRRRGTCRDIPARSSWQPVRSPWAHPSSCPPMPPFGNRSPFGCRAVSPTTAARLGFCWRRRSCWSRD